VRVSRVALGCDDGVRRVAPGWTGVEPVGSAAQGHTSSVRCLCVADADIGKGKRERVVFTAGGSGLIKCWAMVGRAGGLRLQRVCEWPPRGGSTDFRVMDLVSFRSGSAKLCLMAACSDATLRVFSVAPRVRRGGGGAPSSDVTHGSSSGSSSGGGGGGSSGGGASELVIKEMASTAFHGRCVLSLATVDVGGRLLAFSGATDGRVAVWVLRTEGESDTDVPCLDAPLAVWTAHQSGINAIAVQTEGGCSETSGAALCGVADSRDATFLVVTVGDDNAVVVTQWLCCAVTIAGSRSVPVLKRVGAVVVTSAHASSVTGVALLSRSCFATVAADCRLNVWRVDNISTSTSANSSSAAAAVSNADAHISISSSAMQCDDMRAEADDDTAVDPSPLGIGALRERIDDVDQSIAIPLRCDLISSTLLDIDDPQSLLCVRRPRDGSLHVVVTGCGVEVVHCPAACLNTALVPLGLEP
jgi:WD40 repeat protein